jgi:hypothetical protein
MPDQQITYSGRVLLQPTQEPTLQEARREFDCVFIQPGRVLRVDGEPSSWLIPAAVLQEAAPLFDGVASYLDHPEQFGFGWHQEPQVKHLVGVTFGAHWDEEQQAIIGKLRLYDQEPSSAGAIIGALMDQILEDQAQGRPIPSVGLSAVFFHSTHLDENTGYTVTDAIKTVESVDFVYSAGAGGYVRAALARLLPESSQLPGRFTGAPAPQPYGGNPMSEESRTAPVGGQGSAPPETDQPISLDQALVIIGQVADRIEQLDQRVASLTPPTEIPVLPTPTAWETRLSGIEQALTHISTAVANQEGERTVEDMGTPPRGIVRGMHTGMDQVDLAVAAMFDGVRPPDGIRPITGIRELYTLLSGDYEMTGIYHPERIYLANVTSSTMAGLVANALNKAVVNLFMQYPHWWENAVTIVDFANLQDARWVTLGGVGELPTISEGAAYTELTWDDQTETDAFVKKGGYLGLTLEAIDKDDTQKIRSAPRALAQAAWLTLGTSISEIFTSNSDIGPTMADTGALFNATAVSSTGGHVNSSTRLGALTRPRFLWVPVDLETLAIQILATEHERLSADWNINVEAQGNQRETRLANARNRVIVCPLWTDTNNWAAQADPNLYPSIGVGFRYGRTPEIYSVADPRAGLMFSNDVMPVKVRFFYAVGPTDWSTWTHQE